MDIAVCKCSWFFFFCLAVPRGPRCVQASVTGGDPKDKERKEAETEREEAEGDRKPEASGQCQSGPEKPGVCGGALAATRRPGGEYRVATKELRDLLLPVIMKFWYSSLM